MVGRYATATAGVVPGQVSWLCYSLMHALAMTHRGHLHGQADRHYATAMPDVSCGGLLLQPCQVAGCGNHRAIMWQPAAAATATSCGSLLLLLLLLLPRPGLGHRLCLRLRLLQHLLQHR